MSSNLSRGSQQAIDRRSIEDGKIRFAVDTARLFFDTATERIEITDVVKGLKYSEIISLESPLPKIYLSSDSHQLLSYDYTEEEWIIYSGGLAPEKCVVDVYFNDEGNTVIVYGDGNVKVLPGGSEEAKVTALTKRVEELEKIVAKYQEIIEIIEANQS